MVSSMKSLLAVAIIASVACSAYAIQCYVCDSSRDAKCGEKFEAQNGFKSECAAKVIPGVQQIASAFGQNVAINATGCSKHIISRGGQHYVERNCFYNPLSNAKPDCSGFSLDFNIQQTVSVSCDVCSGNLCNGSSNLAPLGLAIVLFYALARIFA